MSDSDLSELSDIDSEVLDAWEYPDVPNAGPKSKARLPYYHLTDADPTIALEDELFDQQDPSLLANGDDATDQESSAVEDEEYDEDDVDYDGDVFMADEDHGDIDSLIPTDDEDPIAEARDVGRNGTDIFKVVTSQQKLASLAHGAVESQRGKRGAGRPRGSKARGAQASRGLRELQPSAVAHGSIGGEPKVRGTRGRSRGRGRGRGRGWGFGPGSMGGVVRGRGGLRGRPRGGRAGRPRNARRPHVAVPSQAFTSLLGKATTAYLERSFDNAAKWASEAIQMNPEIFGAHSLLSEVYLDLGRIEDSLDVLYIGAHTAKEAHVWWEVARRINNIAGEDIDDRLREKVLYCYSQGIRLDKRDIDARKERLKLLKMLSYYARAVNECAQILRLDPTDLGILDEYALLVAARPDDLSIRAVKKAYATAIEQCMSLYPNADDGDFSFSDLNVYLEFLTQVKDWRTAHEAACTISRWLLGRSNELCWNVYGLDDCEWDDDDSRRINVPGYVPDAYPEEAYGLGLPIEIRIRMGMGRLQSDENGFIEAMRHFEHLCPTEKGPDAPIYDYPDFFREVGDILFFNYRFSSALRFYEPLVRAKSAIEPIVRARMGRAYEEIGYIEEATACYQLLTSVEPDNTLFLAELAKLYERQGEVTKATELKERVQTLNAEAKLLRPERRMWTNGPNPRPMIHPIPHRVLLPKPAAKPKLGVNEVIPTATRYRVRTAAAKKLAEKKATADDTENAQYRQEMERMHAQVPEGFSTKATFEQMQEFQRAVIDGDVSATEAWMPLAENMVSMFVTSLGIKALKFKLETAYVQFRGNEHRGRAASMDVFDFPSTEVRQFSEVNLLGWLELLSIYCMVCAKRGDKLLCYGTLQVMNITTMFARSEAYTYRIHTVYLACTLYLRDDETAISVGRWFIKALPRDSNGATLFAALASLHREGAVAFYSDTPTQKFLQRFVKHQDEALQEKYAAGEVLSLADIDTAPYILNGHLSLTFDTSLSARNALNCYLRAHALRPHDPVVSFSICMAALQQTLKEQPDNREGGFMQALAFFQEYRRLRLASAKDANRSLRLEEVAFNEGRLWQAMSLNEHAITAFRKCLEVEEDPNGHFPGYKKEAAYALQQIHAHVGDWDNARAVTEEWLVF